MDDVRAKPKLEARRLPIFPERTYILISVGRISGDEELDSECSGRHRGHSAWGTRWDPEKMGRFCRVLSGEVIYVNEGFWRWLRAERRWDFGGLGEE